MTTSTVSELSRVNMWLMDRLSGDTELNTSTSGRIYVDEAPEGAAVPMVVFQFLGGSDKVLTGTGRLTQVLYLVRAINSSSSYSTIASMADRIEAVLTVPTSGTTVDEVRITACYREQPHQRMDSQFGIRTVYMGGFYRISFQPASQ